eukprot:10914405-Alexandrium_andersonii.AAC.1
MPLTSPAGAPIPDEPRVLLSPTYDPQSGPEEQGRRVAGFLADVSAFDGRFVGVETSQRSLAEGAQAA